MAGGNHIYGQISKSNLLILHPLPEIIDAFFQLVEKPISFLCCIGTDLHGVFYQSFQELFDFVAEYRIGGR
jgi:hypothetical protein